MTAMEDPAAAMEDYRTAAVAADPVPLGISHEFSIEYGLGWVFWWVWTIFGLGFPVSLIDFELGFSVGLS